MYFYVYPGVSRKRRTQHARREHISSSGGRTVCAYQPTYVEHLYVPEIRLDRLHLLRKKIRTTIRYYKIICGSVSILQFGYIKYGFVAHIME